MTTLMIRQSTISCALMLAALTAGAQQLAPGNILITPENRLSVKDKDMRNAIRDWSREQLASTNYAKIVAHPSAAVFPGSVDKSAARVTETVSITHNRISDALAPVVATLHYSQPWRNNMYSTGLYAVAGEYIEVTVPESLIGKDVSIQIGAHSDNLTRWVAGGEDWRRMPDIVRVDTVRKKTTRIASPFGGLIYITASPKSDSWTADVKIARAVKAPLFIAGKTTAEQWKQQLAASKAPWGELATDKVILTIPDSILRQVNDPENVLKLWDLIVGGEMELAQIPQPYYRPQRMVIDEHIGGGFMHSGYPIMIHHSPSSRMLSADVIADPAKLMKGSKGGANWGFFHEIGHNMQNNDWVFGGTTEVSCNFFSLYMFDRLLGGRDDAHTGVSNDETQKAMKNYFAEGPAYQKWQQSPFLGLIMFRQLQEAFGWETYKKFFREYQALAIADPSGEYARGDQKKRDLWAKTFSKVSGRNIAPFFEKWGIPISDDVEKELASLPGWMPYNFPPQ
ncbi:M60 family metallopeptidase [Chitinophaga caseinilytica]|uniref:M60 family metallopeptidase n=1 Tax=Chitinophaga caseinilytica TaxID=2267521 RepID=A0ABZ2Z218_9BACT